MTPGHQPCPVEVADRRARLVTARDLEQPSQVLVLEALVGVHDEAVGHLAKVVEEPAAEGRQAWPPEHDRQF